MGRIAAIDYGGKRIGIALSDERGEIALPYKTVEGGKQGVEAVAAALAQKLAEIDEVVIGLPLLLNGQKGEMALLVEEFGRRLEVRLAKRVSFFDERLSSRHAESSLKEAGWNRKERASRSDEAAATLLLQSYLEMKKWQR